MSQSFLARGLHDEADRVPARGLECNYKVFKLSFGDLELRSAIHAAESIRWGQLFDTLYRVDLVESLICGIDPHPDSTLDLKLSCEPTLRAFQVCYFHGVSVVKGVCPGLVLSGTGLYRDTLCMILPSAQWRLQGSPPGVPGLSKRFSLQVNMFDWLSLQSNVADVVINAVHYTLFVALPHCIVPPVSPVH